MPDRAVDSVLEVLTDCASLLADVDRGDTLLRIYDALRETDSWLRAR